MHLLSFRTGTVLALVLLAVPVGCRSEMDPPVNSARNGGAGGGTGGRGATGGRGGGSIEGGSGGTAGGGSGGSGGATSGGAGGGADAADAGDAPDGQSGGEVGDSGDTGGPDVTPAEVLPPDAPVVPGGCGDQIAAALTMGAVAGIVVAPDGTLYFTQGTAANFIGRIRPGMPAERNWLASGGQVFGITFDPKRNAIYAGRRTGGTAVLRIDLNQTPPAVTALAPAQNTIGALTLGEDEAVYYAEETGRTIRRVTYFGQPSLVTARALPGNPSALAFGPDEDATDQRHYLFVVYASASQEATRLTLTNAGETARTVHIANVGAAGAQGAAFDDMGRLYVSAGGQLRRIAANGARVETMLASSTGPLEFGIGALNCRDIYAGSASTGLRRHTLEARGMLVPWHRPGR
jgi:hypothetical protein